MPELLDIVGQDSALVQLQQALAGGRRHHAYLFAGKEGVGRRTTAVEFAKLLLCENPSVRPNAGRFAATDDDFPLRQACGRCGSCRTVSAGTNQGHTACGQLYSAGRSKAGRYKNKNYQGDRLKPKCLKFKVPTNEDIENQNVKLRKSSAEG